ncbi:16S rRNA pseudouridine(516) synthase [Marinobacterium aestuarii]|uniref:Pseudouridine synthase n=1 Tax=Marinobacterium aestuarii TaxID=1821621 RepID=A0A1A9F2I0_9GAMM|nr:pseudouridine synthase [Marinobacterium aestuarii]ANG64200.1 16S rRNA pseudouridine(516) synthase [Marinobacterium aestuarii]
MQSRFSRLDRFISVQTGIKRKDVRLLLAQGRVQVDGVAATDIQLSVGEFSQVLLDGQVLQANTPRYVMLHKPVGVVSATRDDEHRTVIDLLQADYRHSLHIAGRLDLNSSGLLLLTNDGRWSRGLSAPDSGVCKRYRVTLANPIGEEYIQAFAEGMYFDYEGIRTRPAGLRILDTRVAEVTLTEGRYHQIKRMFGRFRNPVLALHRCAIGNLVLDAALAPGQSRELSAAEVADLRGQSSGLA